MSTARHVATIDLLCARPFPAERTGSEVGTSGPGYHLAELAIGESFGAHDGSGRALEAEQYEAECTALASVLTTRWGEPHLLSLWNTHVRATEGEDIPAPWRELSAGVAYVHLWRTEPHWLAIGIAYHGDDHPLQLLATITETDPP